MPRKKAILKLPLAWLHNQGDDVFQIPGNKNQQRIEENAKAALFKLTPAKIKEIEAIVTKSRGGRYHEQFINFYYVVRMQKVVFGLK